MITSAPPEFILTDTTGVVIATSGSTASILSTSGASTGDVLTVQGDGTLNFATPVVTESLTDLDEWTANTLTVPGALTVRQAGGVAGTDEVQIYHDGTDAYVDSQSGDLIFNNSNAKVDSSGNFTNSRGVTDTEVFGSEITAVAAVRSVIIGNNAMRGVDHSTWNDKVIIGYNAYCNASAGIAIGSSAVVNGSGSIAIGYGTTATSAYQLVVGRIQSAYFGRGVTHSSPEDFTLHATGGSGTDISGANLILAGGKPTGAGTPGQVQFQVAPSGASGTTLGTLATVGLFDEQGLTVRQAGGVAGTDEVQIYHDGTDGYIVSQSGLLRTTGTLYISDTPQIYFAGSVFEPSTINFRNYSAIKAKAGFGSHSDFSLLFESPVNTTVMIVERTGRVGIGIGATRPDYLFELGGEFALNELSADPSDPDEGKSVLWQSDGTGSGDDGDIMVKITAGGVTKTATLIDFSAV